MTATTADLLDEYGDRAAVCLLPLRQYGGLARFAGEVATVRCVEDNVLVKRCLTEPGNGRVLVVDGGGSLRVALLGDRLATLARTNGWTGLVVNGAVRDAATLRTLELGIKALGSNPRPSGKSGAGEVGVPVTFGEIVFRPGDRLTSDDDGIVVIESS